MKTSINLVFTFIVLAFCPLFSSSCMKFDDKPPYITKQFALGNGGNLVVKTSGGSITVLGGGGSEVKVEVFVKKSGGWFSSDEDIKDALKDYKITVKKEGTTIYALAQKGDDGSWFFSNNVSISFKVYVPNKIDCDLKTSGGSINLSKVIGDQKVNTSGGSLSLNSIRGNLNAHTSGGGINIKNYKGNLDAHTSGGSINILEAKGVIKAHTSGGGIDLDEVYGSIDASTSGGSISADIKELGKFVDLHTSGGSIDATIPGNLGLDLDLKGNSVNTKLSNFSGESKRDKVNGRLNGGGIPVKLSTSGGSVSLNYRM